MVTTFPSSGLPDTGTCFTSATRRQIWYPSKPAGSRWCSKTLADVDAWMIYMDVLIIYHCGIIPHLSPFGKSWRSLTHPRPHIPCTVRPLKRWRVELQEAQVEFAEWSRHFDLTGCVTDGVVDVNGCHSSSKIFKTWISLVSSCIFWDTTAGMTLTTSTKEQTARFTRLQWRCTEHLVCYRPGTACVLATLQQHHVYIYIYIIKLYIYKGYNGLQCSYNVDIFIRTC